MDRVEFNNNEPIYLQLVELMKRYIISGALSPGERIPSVRDLALKFKVNPNTVQRALMELENLGLIYTERTNGKFVTGDKKLIIKYKNELAKEITLKFLSDMQAIGMDIKIIKEYINDIGERK